jgi:hypothetical protein
MILSLTLISLGARNWSNSRGARIGSGKGDVKAYSSGLQSVSVMIRFAAAYVYLVYLRTLAIEKAFNTCRSKLLSNTYHALFRFPKRNTLKSYDRLLRL